MHDGEGDSFYCVEIEFNGQCARLMVFECLEFGVNVFKENLEAIGK